MRAHPPSPKPLSRGEFIALLGVLFATIAFSIDAMLPALPQIAAELSPDRVTLAQLVLTSFVLGLGIGTFLAGPLSDHFGRKPVIIAGGLLYIAGAMLAYFAPSLELILAARVVQGLGAAGPRVVSLAMVRDLYSGRAMAQVISFAMLVFTLFPAVAPLMGAAIIAGFGWRAIFAAFICFAVFSVGWLWLRQPETLLRSARVSLNPGSLWSGAREALAHKQMQLSILCQTLVFGALFATISSIQQVFEFSYGRAESFPVYFALIALCASPAAPLNGWLVARLGMRPLIRRALVAQTVLSIIMAVLLATAILGSAEFWTYLAWSVTIFAMLGFTVGNLNTLALEPLGHIAGLASSLMGGLATVGGAALGAAVGQLFDGSALPLALACAVLSGAAALLMRNMPREGRAEPAS